MQEGKFFIFFLVQIINFSSRFVDESLFVHAYCLFSVFAYAHYGWCVIVDMAEVLKIKVWTIPEKAHVVSKQA